jgi:hypothetical protein
MIVLISTSSVSGQPVNDKTATGGGFGGEFYNEPGERGPLSFFEILTAHKAFKMAAAGVIEKPRGVSRARWDAACEIARDVTPGLCWLLGHLGGEGGRLLDLIVRSAGPMLAGLPEPGAEDYPPMYAMIVPPAGACKLCVMSHNPKLPHDLTPFYQCRFFSQTGRRPSLLDASCHCAEPIQGLFAAFWSDVGCWPILPSDFKAPHWFGAALQNVFAKCQKYL